MKPKKPRPRKPRERPDLRRLAAPPPADFYRLPELELRGGNLLTDGCRRVLDFTPQRICLDMGNTLVTLYGADLRIESFAGKRLIAAGLSSSIPVSMAEDVCTRILRSCSAERNTLHR